MTNIFSNKTEIIQLKNILSEIQSAVKTISQHCLLMPKPRGSRGELKVGYLSPRCKIWMGARSGLRPGTALTAAGICRVNHWMKTLIFASVSIFFVSLLSIGKCMF